jgi:hypothetical protein
MVDDDPRLRRDRQHDAPYAKAQLKNPCPIQLCLYRGRSTMKAILRASIAGTTLFASVPICAAEKPLDGTLLAVPGAQVDNEENPDCEDATGRNSKGSLQPCESISLRKASVTNLSAEVAIIEQQLRSLQLQLQSLHQARSDALLPEPKTIAANGAENAGGLLITTATSDGVRSTKVSRDNDAVTLQNCMLPKAIDASTYQLAVFREPNKCRKLLVEKSQQSGNSKEEEVFGPPSTFDFSQSLTAGSAGGLAKLEVSNTFSRFDLSFEMDRNGKTFSRKPKDFNYSLAVEAKIEDGLANIIGGNSDDANFFSLDRLNSKFQLSGSLGINFYPRQSAETFTKSANEFFRDARNACLNSVKKEAAKAVAKCSDENLLVWLVALSGKDYAREKLVQAYDKLLWNSDADYPEYGFGGRFSAGLRNRDFHNFQGESGKFDASLVDAETFFTDPKASNRFGEINNRLAYSLGAYGYYHFTKERIGWGEGVTAFVSATLKGDLPDLGSKEIEICRPDLSSIANDGAFERGDFCKKTLPFAPEFENTFIPSIEFRIGLPKPSWSSKWGLGIKVSSEIGPAQGDTLRLEAPLYLSIKDDVLTGGVGVAHEVHFVPGKANTSASTLFIFVGRKFSLDGSKIER